MAFTETSLFSQEATTAATSAYSPGSGETAIIKQITVCNHEATAQAFSIWLDVDGSTYDDAVIRFAATSIAAQSTVLIDTYWIMNDASGNLAIWADANSKITISADGAVVT